jgi:RNA polymerase sigma-70 factor (ECF subfamily)
MSKRSKPEDDERELISRVLNGDSSAFESLASRHTKTIFAMLYRVLQKQEDAVDLTQEVFLRAYKSLGTFRGDQSFSAWIARIAQNLAIDHLRRTKAGLNLPMATEPAGTLAASATEGVPKEALVIFDGRLSEQQVKAVLESLADYYRSCGGIGIEVEFDGVEVAVRESILV